MEEEGLKVKVLSQIPSLMVTMSKVIVLKFNAHYPG